MNNLAPSFEQAMRVATIWTEAWERCEISDEVLADRVGELVATKDGIRGFFVVSMAGDCPLLDRMPDALIFELRRAGENIVDITVKNLAMSSAMAINHQRSDNLKQKQGSERVAARCIDLLRSLDPKLVKERLETLLRGIDGRGDDAIFLDRWGYDSEQKMAILSNVNCIARS